MMSDVSLLYGKVDGSQFEAETASGVFVGRPVIRGTVAAGGSGADVVAKVRLRWWAWMPAIVFSVAILASGDYSRRMLTSAAIFLILFIALTAVLQALEGARVRRIFERIFD
jgi:hypothetical protein